MKLRGGINGGVRETCEWVPSMSAAWRGKKGRGRGRGVEKEVV